MRRNVSTALDLLRAEIETLEERTKTLTESPTEIMGGYEIAEFLGWSPGRTWAAISRGQLPPPWRQLRMGAVWRREDIEKWANERSAA